MMCTSPTRDASHVMPGVSVEPITPGASAGDPVTPAFEREVLLANFYGSVHRRMIYVVPKDEEYVGFRIIGSRHYQVSCDRLSKGASLNLREDYREDDHSAYAAAASATVMSQGGSLNASYEGDRQHRDGSIQHYESNVSVIRILVSGGKDGGCCSAGSEVSIFLRTQKKSPADSSPDAK